LIMDKVQTVAELKQECLDTLSDTAKRFGLDDLLPSDTGNDKADTGTHEEFLTCSDEHPDDIPQADLDEMNKMLRDAHERDDEQSEQKSTAQVLSEQKDRDYCITNANENKADKPIQHFENLPDEILNAPRFFLVGKNKVPLTKGWSNPENQRDYRDVKGVAGFDTCGRGQAVDYLLLDFDHVLTDSGEFVNETAQKWFKSIHEKLKTYCERSISGHGLHIFAKPTADKFAPISNGKNGVLKFGDDAKLEIFYKNKARYCLVTGDVFECAPKTAIASGEVVDEVLQKLLDAIQKQLQAKEKPAAPKSEQPAESEKRNRTAQDTRDREHEDEHEYDLYRAEKMLKLLSTVSHNDLTYSQWLAINTACKQIGVPYSVVDAFNQCDPTNYNAEENRKRWATLPFDSNYNIETIHGIAKQFGYDERTVWHEWHDNRAGYVKRNNSDTDSDGIGKSTEEIIAQIRDRCEWRAVKVSDGDGKPQFKKISIKPTQANLNLIFGEDPNLRGLVGHDQFCGVDIFLKRAPWHDKDEDRTGEQWNDTDNAQLRVYLRNVYADLEHEKKISDTRIDFARKNSFNAVKQFLSSLPKWDGEARAATLFGKFLHAEDSEYTRVVTLNFLLGSIARVYYPGVEFANCIVLQGAQRIGKSRLIRMLGGKEGVNPNGQNWHVALKDSVDDSHATDALMKGWIIEIEEFSAARKAEVNNLKTFISATEDTRRFSYDKYATTRQRKNSFVVTCNDSQIFRDKTGNARFIVVKCSQKKFDRVPGMTAEYIRQVWAEALHIYNEHFNGLSKEEAGAKLLLPLKIQEQAEAIAETYTQDDGMTLEITSYLDRKIPLQAIWLLLTKERRRKFIADGKIEVDQAELNFARRAQGGRNAQEDIDKIDSYLHGKSGVLKQNFTVAGGGTQEKFILFGTEYRKHICAAEIFQECFGQDKRKSMTRINEILTTLDGWTEGRRLRKADPEYNDQKHP
ncbi:MAG: hypothetical protein IJG24_06910, partial [Selenomonadaceae bacterium]|nr:hypothetical protein [Selenomonadaceae bacterium]